MSETPNNLTKEEKIAHVRKLHESGLSQKAYAEKHNLIHSSLSYWVKLEREKHTPRVPRAKSLAVQPASQPVKIQATGNSQQRIDTLEAENRDLRAKISSLQNVVMVLGHQMGE